MPMCHYDRYRHHQHDDSAPGPNPNGPGPTAGARSLRSRMPRITTPPAPKGRCADERVHQRGLRPALRVTHIAARFEELISDEANDAVTPEQLFLTAVDDAMDARTAGKIDKLIKAAKFPIPTATIVEIDYRDGPSTRSA